MRDLIIEATERQAKLDQEIEELKVYGVKAAESDRDYLVALAKKILLLKQTGMPATLVRDIARGEKEIADLRLERDKNMALYDAAKESIMNHKQRIKSINDTVAREYGRA